MKCQVIIKGLDHNKRKIKTREVYVEGDEFITKDLFAKITSTRLKKLTAKQLKEIAHELYEPIRLQCIEDIIKLKPEIHRKDIENESSTYLMRLKARLDFNSIVLERFDYKNPNHQQQDQ